MPVPDHHTLDTIHLAAFTPSCATAPVAAYVHVPLRCRLLKASGILGGPISIADGTITVTVQNRVLASFAVVQAGSTAGMLFSAAPPSPAFLNEDDVLVLTPSGASGASVPMHFQIAVRAA